MALDLFQAGAYMRTAGGNVQNVADQKPVIQWAAWSINQDNGGGGSPDIWALSRQLWKSVGIQHFPWLHCRELADVTRLVAVGTQFSSPAIGLNIEDVFNDFTRHGVSLQDIAQKIAGWQGEVHMATLPHVQNGQGWGALARAVAALEIFANEQPNTFPSGRPDPATIEAEIQHAFAEGLTKVTLMLKTKGFTPADYGRSFPVCHSLYTGDDIPPLTAAWAAWKQTQPCERPTGGTVPPKPPLSVAKFPYTGPCFGPSHVPGPTLNRKTVKALKRGMIRLGRLRQDLPGVTDDFGPELEKAMQSWQRSVDVEPTGQYGRGSWLELREAVVPAEFQHAGEYAMDSKALALVREDDMEMIYPHPQGALSSICQGLHETAGLMGNWAIDFCAPGGTKVLAVERATIRKLSGRDPASGANQKTGIFGWSIHYETPKGYRYFSTHYGARSPLAVDQIVDVGQVLGTVGHWPGDPPRSHTHLGVTSPKGVADAKKRITAISTAAKVPA